MEDYIFGDLIQWAGKMIAGFVYKFEIFSSEVCFAQRRTSEIHLNNTIRFAVSAASPVYAHRTLQSNYHHACALLY